MRTLSTASAVLLVGLLANGVVVAQDFDSAGEEQMLARINAMRAAQQLRPLSRHDGLDAAARSHSGDMASQRALTHVSATTGTPADRVRRTGVSATTIAENVALHRSADEAHQALLASDAHRANMMSPDITHAGLAALRTDQGVYVTQVFAALAAGPAAPIAPLAPAPVQEAPTAPSAPPPPLAPPPPFVPPSPLAGGAAVERDDCVSPLPGVRICGGLAAPRASEAEPAGGAQQESIALPPPLAPAAPLAPVGIAPPTGQIVVQPGSNGTVVIQHAPDGRVGGYWVHGSGRWWYYPLPAGWRPGQQLQPDLRVSGPPPGFPAHPFGPAPPQVQPAGPRPQAWGIAPPLPPPPTSGVLQPAPGHAQLTIAPGGGFYAVPPPPMMGQPDRAWRRAHSQWMRAYQRWLRGQARLRRRSF